jgi:hypothetical protein
MQNFICLLKAGLSVAKLRTKDETANGISEKVQPVAVEKTLKIAIEQGHASLLTDGRA